MSNYLFGINSLGVPNVPHKSPYDNSLPNSSCTNGSPTDTYAGYGGKSWEVLYSIWSANQSTLGAQFTSNQALTYAPGDHPVCQGPANIFIIRQAEKNQDKPNYDLNSNGIYRSCQLIGFVNELAAKGYPISYIITCNSCPFSGSNSSMRPVQTASIISFMLNIPMYIYGASQNYAAVTNALFPTPTPGVVNQYDGLNVMIVWDHGSIQQLSLSLMNAAGPLGRLPTNIQPTENNPLWWGDSFFLNNDKCPDGHYECKPGDENYYATYDPSTGPSIIGPNNSRYPYWNTNNNDSIYWFKSQEPDYTYTFEINQQPCFTCTIGCGLHIGLYQPTAAQCGSTPHYYDKTVDNIEDLCEKPVDWQID